MATIALPITNGTFAGNINGWTSLIGAMEYHPSAHPPPNGHAIGGGVSSLSKIEQEITLTVQQKADIAAGIVSLTLDFLAGSYSTHDALNAEIVFMDAVGTEIQTSELGAMSANSTYPYTINGVSYTGVWVPIRVKGYAPTTATRVKIRLSAIRNSGSYADGYISNVTLSMDTHQPVDPIVKASNDLTWELFSGNISANVADITFNGLAPLPLHPINSSYATPYGIQAIGDVDGSTGAIQVQVEYNSLSTPLNTDNMYAKAFFYDQNGLYLGTDVTSHMTKTVGYTTATRSLSCPIATRKMVMRLVCDAYRYHAPQFTVRSLAVTSTTLNSVDTLNYTLPTYFQLPTWGRQAPVLTQNLSVGYAVGTTDLVSSGISYVSGLNFTTCEIKSFVSLFYSTVYIIPVIHNFGDIQSNQTLTYHLWNANIYSPVSITTMAFDTTGGRQGRIANGGGVDFPITPLPKTLSRLELAPFDLLAFATGPIKLNAKLDHTILTPTTDEPGSPLGSSLLRSLEVVGDRGTVLPLAHNWVNSYRIEYEFKTEIIKSYDGTEQRRSTRFHPRRSIDVKGFEYPEGKEAILKSGQAAMLVPECTELLPVTALGGSITVHGDQRWINNGQAVFIGDTCSSPDLTPTTILSVDRLGAEPVVQVGAAIPDGNYNIYSSLIGRANKVSGKFVTSTVGVITASVDETPGSWSYTPTPLPVGVIDGTVQHTGVFYGTREVLLLDGMEIFDIDPNWAGGVGIDYKPQLKNVDFGNGPIEYGIKEIPEQVLKYRYISPTYEEYRFIMDFFLRQKGRRGSILVPSAIDDVPYKTITGLNGATVILKSPFLHGQMTLPYGVSIRKGGRWTHFKILNITGADVVLTETFAEDFTSPDKVSWLYKSRLAGDKLATKFKTSYVSEVNLGIKLL